MPDKDEFQKALDAANLAAWMQNQEALRAQQDRLQAALDKELAKFEKEEREKRNAPRS